ncbi:MAG: hypothetical protein JO247_08930 [Chloroflexi bacterium]|nr:hypothetical protein [Chloroflexota bacterium]
MIELPPAPRGPVQASRELPDNPRQVLTELWQEALGVASVAPDDNFFSLGATSLEAVWLLTQIQERLGVELSLQALWQQPTLDGLAGLLGTGDQGLDSPPNNMLVSLGTGVGRPLFFISPVDGNPFHYSLLADRLRADVAPYALRAPGLEDPADRKSTIEDLAACYLRTVQTLQSKGPYLICGFSFGGAVAYEMARQLRAAHQEVALLAALDDGPANWGFYQVPVTVETVATTALNVPYWTHDYLRRAQRGRLMGVRSEFLVMLKRLRGLTGLHSASAVNQGIGQIWDVSGLPAGYLDYLNVHFKAMHTYQPRAADLHVTLFRARAQWLMRLHDPYLGWRQLARGGVERVTVPGSHGEMIRDPYVGVLAQALSRAIAKHIR